MILINIISLIIIAVFFLGGLSAFIIIAWLSRLNSQYSNLLGAFKKKKHIESYPELVKLSQGLTMLEIEALLELFFQHPIKIMKSQCDGEVQLDWVCRSDISYEEMNLANEQNKQQEYIG